MLQYIVDLSTASYFVADPVVETEDYNDLIIYITEIDNALGKSAPVHQLTHQDKEGQGHQDKGIGGVIDKARRSDAETDRQTDSQSHGASRSGRYSAYDTNRIWMGKAGRDKRKIL